jgi:tetratricopeptide (TPR) repeat protein
MLRRLILLCVCVMFLGAAGGTSARGEEITIFQPGSDYFLGLGPSEAVRAARELIAQGKINEAIGHLETYVEQYPDRIEPHRFLGDLYVRTGQLDRAKYTYLQILQRAPRDKETHNRLGTVYAVENQVDAAIAQFAESLPGTDSVDDLVALHERRGDLDSYQTQIERLAHDNPNDPGIQSELGQVYAAVHQPYLASTYFQRTLASDPENLTALNGLGLAYLALDDYSEAITQFERCLFIDTYAYSCADNMGATQLEMGDFTAAKATLDRAYKMAPERGETFVNYGYLDDEKGDWQGAITQYARAIATWPYIREAYIDIGLSYEEHHLYALAEEALVKGMASVSDDGRMHFLLGRAYEMQGDRADALAQFKLAASGTDPTADRLGAQRFAELTSAAPTTPKPQ